MVANPRSTPTLTVTSEKTEVEAIVHCAGRITEETVHELRHTARKAISESQRVLLDFNEVTYVDSSGLGMIVGLLISAKKVSCELKLVNLTPRVREIFTLTRVLEYFGMTPD